MPIFVKQNGSWVNAPGPQANVNGTWTQVVAAWIRENGTWLQFFPNPVEASIIVVGGGGGGGASTVDEGGGGGGGGGVVTGSLTLDPINTYNVVVGAGGACGYAGSYSVFGGSAVIQSPNVNIYPSQNGAYCAFLNDYGVWTDPSLANPIGQWVSATYEINVPTSGNYTLTISGDNHIRVIYNGNTIGSYDDYHTSTSSTITLPAGIITFQINALNDGGPGSFGAALTNSNGAMIWNTRVSGYIAPQSILANGGGSGGHYNGAPNWNGQDGASGGGGSGCGQANPGGAGIPGQGTSGQTGPHEAIGGGGGGFATPGGSSGNFADGGTGTTVSVGSPAVASWAVGGGGGGGAYGGGGGNRATSNPQGSNGGHAGAGGGGGLGAALNGVDGTGGGGMGSGSAEGSAGGTGGCGLVVVYYKAPFAYFSGGSVTADGTNVTHVFNSAGTFSLTPLA